MTAAISMHVLDTVPPAAGSPSHRQGEEGGRLAIVREYRGLIERELQDICGDVLAVLESHLLPHASSHESHVFYCKM